MSIKMKNIISITEARSNIFAIAEKVQKRGNYYTFTENGRPKVVMMSAEEHENLIEDLELMNNPKFMARVRNMEKAFTEGEYVPWGDVKKKLAKKNSQK